MQTKLTVPISAKDLDTAIGQVKAAKACGAEMIELRTDYLENLSTYLVRKLIDETKNITNASLPIIVTCRDPEQGGARPYPQKLRIDVLSTALKAGVEFVDLEYENFIPIENQEKIRLALSQNPNSQLILSAHNFKSKFADIAKLHRHILTVYPVAIPKLVYTANHINDCFDAFDLLYRTNGDAIVFCMGSAGLISRIIAKKLNSFLTFAKLDDKSGTAPGQLTVRQFKELYRYDSINADTELYGIIGSPVAHSLSPVFHNAGFDDIKANKLYLPLCVEGSKKEFDQFVDNVLSRKWLGFRGFSVTIPHKQNALDYAMAKQGTIESLTEKIGAVNTLLIGAEKKLNACNTDYAGALDAIVSKLKIDRADLQDMDVAVIGAGGVARAIVAGLSDAGARIKIYNRTVKKCEKLAAEFGCYFAALHELPNINAKLVINCTSIGMHPNVDNTPLAKEFIKKEMAVFDTVYNPAQTLLLKDAEDAGAKTINGTEMFIKQGLAQFKLFTGTNGNEKLLRKIVSNCLCAK